MPHDAVGTTVTSKSTSGKGGASDARDLQWYTERQFAYAQFVQSLDSALAARLVRLEGEVFALRRQLALLSRSAGSPPESASEA